MQRNDTRMMQGILARALHAKALYLMEVVKIKNCNCNVLALIRFSISHLVHVKSASAAIANGRTQTRKDWVKTNATQRHMHMKHIRNKIHLITMSTWSIKCAVWRHTSQHKLILHENWIWLRKMFTYYFVFDDSYQMNLFKYGSIIRMDRGKWGKNNAVKTTTIVIWMTWNVRHLKM